MKLIIPTQHPNNHTSIVQSQKMASPIDNTLITGVILAGGRGSRMGGQDKGLVLLSGRYMIDYVIAALRPQVGDLLISANRHIDDYAKVAQCPVLADSFGHYDGPVAGMATALAAAQTDYVLFAPCDSPRVSSQLAQRLYTRLIQTDAKVSVAYDGNRIHSVFSLLKRSLLTDLLAFLESGERSIQRFFAMTELARADFSDIPETLLNINTCQQVETFVSTKSMENLVRLSQHQKPY
jgi:molybdopterin-guanine dinucleotide biosynthesis protein A